MKSLIISVGETEFLPLLDSAKSVADMKQVFTPQLKVLRDLANYGTSLIPRTYRDSGKQMKDITVIGVLLRQVVAMLDAIEILVSNGAVYAATLQVRALFEASIYMEWILKDDSEKKALFYYVYNLRQRRRWAMRLQAGTPEAGQFVAEMPDLPTLHSPEMTEHAKKEVEQIDKILAQQEFASICSVFKQFKGKSNWYSPLGIPDLRSMAKDVGKGSEYIVFYSNYSESMHTSNYTHHVKFGKGTITFQPIRLLERFKGLFNHTGAIAIGVYRRILTEYRPGELDGFRRKYIEKWQKAFLEVPNVNYEKGTADIP